MQPAAARVGCICQKYVWQVCSLFSFKTHNKKLRVVFSCTNCTLFQYWEELKIRLGTMYKGRSPEGGREGLKIVDENGHGGRGFWTNGCPLFRTIQNVITTKILMTQGFMPWLHCRPAKAEAVCLRSL